MSCREIDTVCPERYRDTFIGIIFKNTSSCGASPQCLSEEAVGALVTGPGVPRGAWRTRAAEGGGFSPTSPPLSRVVPHPPPPGMCLAWSGPLLPSSLPAQGPYLMLIWAKT